MPESFTISTQKPANAAFDYEELRKIGIRHIEQTASSLWTDYNVHDPGITTLELLCYAVTDLSHRAAYSIPDLLATEKDTVSNIQKHFLSAKQIFPNKAVTINDYRKLIIDIEGVKNAWLKKNTKEIFADLYNKKLSLSQPNSKKWEPVAVKGYYDVLIEFDTDVEKGGRTGIKKKVRETLMANRNVCEDFINVGEIARQEFRLCSEIEIRNAADPFDTLARIFFNIQLHLTPLIKFYRLKELLDQQYTSDKIFEGPLLSNGFIKDEELVSSDLKTEIHLSDIMSEILKITGVSNILSIVFNSTGKNDESLNKWVIPVSGGKQAMVDIAGSKVLLYKDGIPFRPDLAVVKLRFDKLMKDYIVRNDSYETEDITYDTGSYQDTGSYYSIQNHYPKNYGISHWGLPGDATNQRQVQAKQLQGYLYFFDQHLANYFSQLSHLRNLFSLDEEERTYFTQLVSNFKDANSLFVDYDIGTKSLSKSSDAIQSAAEIPGSDAFYQRRNLFLDHLLSRFAESFFDYVNVLQTVAPSWQNKDVLSTKINFLKNYPEYSSQRFRAYNYSDGGSLWDTDNTSGLEKRLERLLGCKNIKRRTLVNIYTIIRQAFNAANVKEFWFEIVDNRSGTILMVAAERFPSAESAERRLEDVYQFKSVSNFTSRIDPADGKFIFELKDAAHKVIAVSGERFNTFTDADANVTKVTFLFIQNQAEEGMFLVEHLLLLPEVRNEEVAQSSLQLSLLSPPQSPPLSPPQSPPQSPPVAIDGSEFLPICADENCDDCVTRDPYSFRISIVLPAYAPRFLDIDFRRYCERIIRMEVPAHIFPKICWVSNEQLQEFEKAYKDWLDVKAGNTRDSNGNIRVRFINILTTLKTVYPAARLKDCSNNEERKLFLLNRNALGTIKT